MLFHLQRRDARPNTPQADRQLQIFVVLVSAAQPPANDYREDQHHCYEQQGLASLTAPCPKKLGRFFSGHSFQLCLHLDDRERFELITSHHLRQLSENWLIFWEKPCFCVPWKQWPAAWISKPFVWLAPPSCNRTDLRLLLYKQLLEATKYYDDDDYSLLQPKGSPHSWKKDFLWNHFIKWWPPPRPPFMKSLFIFFRPFFERKK